MAAMEFLRKAKNKIVEATGYGSEGLDEYKQHHQTLSRLENQISGLKSTIIHYAKSMQSMSAAACSAASEVGKFYSSSKARAKSVKLFTDAHFKLESLSDDLFKDQVPKDILKLLDDWTEEVKKAKKLVNQTQQAASQVAQQTEKVKALASQKEKRTAKGQPLAPKEEQQIVDEEKTLEKYSKLLAQMRASVEKTVTKLLDGRFSRFDACFVRMMEIQVDFFRQGMAQTETFCANIDNYRRRYPRSSGETKEPASSPTSPQPPTSQDGADYSSTMVEAPKSQDGSEPDWDLLRAQVSTTLGGNSEEEAKQRLEQRRKEAEEEAQKAAKQKSETEKQSGDEVDTSSPPGDFLSLFGKDSGVPPTPPTSNDRGIAPKRGKLTITTELPPKTEHQAPLSAPARSGTASTSSTNSLFEELESGPILEDKLHVAPAMFSPISPRSPLSPMMPSMDNIFPDVPGSKDGHDFVDIFRTDDAPAGLGVDEPLGRGDAVPPTPPPSARGERKHPGLDLAKLSAGLSGLASVQTTPAPVPPTPPPSARGNKPPLSSLNLDALSASLAELAENSDPMSPSPRSPGPMASPKVGPISTSGTPLDFADDGADTFDPFSDTAATPKSPVTSTGSSATAAPEAQTKETS